MFFLTTAYSANVVAVEVVYCLWMLSLLRILVLLWFGVLGKLKKMIWQMSLAHVRFSHRSPSGSGERQSEAIPSSDTFSNFFRMLYFSSFCAEILSAFPNQLHAKLQPLFSWEHHDSGSDCLVWTLTRKGTSPKTASISSCGQRP